MVAPDFQSFSALVDDHGAGKSSLGFILYQLYLACLVVRKMPLGPQKA